MALTKKTLRSLPAGRHADTGQHGVQGLYLDVKASGRRNWLGRTKIAGKPEHFGLGPLNEVPLELARVNWAQIKNRLRAGETVAQVKGKAERDHLFSALAGKAYAARAVRLKDKKADQWLSSVERALGPLWDEPITALTAPVLLKQLEPTVKKTPETAKKVLGRISVVFKYAAALGIVAFNPSDAVKTAAPWPKHRVKNHAAVSIADAPAVFQKIAASGTVSADALVVTILTGARSGTIRHMTHDMIDGDTFSAPAEIMKADKDHDYPLTPIAQDRIAKWQVYGNTFVFEARPGKAMSDMSLLKPQKNASPDTTVHGWRSALTDWARETLGISSDEIDAVLAHSAKGARAAYARSDLLEKRRNLLAKWEAFLTKNPNSCD